MFIGGWEGWFNRIHHPLSRIQSLREADRTSLILETEAQRRLILPVQAKPNLKTRSCHPCAGLAFGVHQSPSKPFTHGGYSQKWSHTGRLWLVGHWEASRLACGGTSPSFPRNKGPWPRAPGPPFEPTVWNVAAACPFVELPH